MATSTALSEPLPVVRILVSPEVILGLSLTPNLKLTATLPFTRARPQPRTNWHPTLYQSPTPTPTPNSTPLLTAFGTVVPGVLEWGFEVPEKALSIPGHGYALTSVDDLASAPGPLSLI